MKKIQIKGKDYIEVNERVKQFHIDYPNGSISTELIEMTDRFITKTTVVPDVTNAVRMFTGIAYEKEDSTFINKTSALENCETSSVGRALGMMGIGIDTSIASYNEVANAVKQQDEPKVANTTPVSPPAPPKINLQDQEVKFKEVVVDKFDGVSVGDDDWDGEEVCRFGKYRDVQFKKIQDASWLSWVSTSSAVDWQRELATKELKRRGK
tara:strand:- start:214 stop:843 length:630 start_codon:yes stop_codon:yes gene_type:complete